jgi:RNA polymerase sigma factor (sigma-70 family)
LTQEISDETLCRRVGARDEAAFDVLVARYQGRAYRLAWSLLRNAEDARDVSQEAFLRVYRTAAGFRGDARFSTWFYRILVNLCLDHRRRGRGWLQRLVRDDGVGDPSSSGSRRRSSILATPWSGRR